MERVVGWERQPQGSQQGRGSNRAPPPPGCRGARRAGLMQRTSWVGAGTYFDGAVQRSHAVTPPPLPCTHKQGAQRQSGNPPSPPCWAPELGTRPGPLPGTDTLIPFPPLKRGGVGWGRGEVEKEEQKEEDMDEEERWCQRNRRGKRGGEVEQQRGAKTVAPLHTPWPKPWAPSVLTWLPGPPAAQHPGPCMKAGGVHV